MSNSIYATKDGANMKLFEAVSLEGHIHPDAASAKSNPVDIYVERVLAKVSLTTELTLFNGFKSKEVDGTAPTIDNAFVAKNKTGDKTSDIVIEGKQVYVQLLGWNVTATANQSYLMKHIDPSWDFNLFGESQPWNWEGHRSFWAINPEGTNVVYGPFVEPKDGETEPNIAQAIKGFKTPGEGGPANFTYVQENAAVGTTTATYPNATANPTQVIIAAQLLDEYGDPLTVAEYAGTLYAGTEDVKKLYANALSNVWVEVTSTSSDDDDDNAVQADQRKFVKVGPDNIDFKTATAAGKASETEKGRYYVYAVLAPTSGEGDNKKYEYYTLTPTADGFTAEEANVNKVNGDLMALGHAKVWNEGLTYYYFDIRHLNGTALPKAGEETDYDAQLRTPGYFGVVRNHVYESKVTGVYGLGTPVFDPAEKIIPEHPDKDNTVIAAQIEILSWRVVNNNYELVW